MLLLDLPGSRPLGGLPLKAQSLFRRSLGVRAPSYRPLGIDLPQRSRAGDRLGQSASIFKPGIAGSLLFLAAGAGGLYFSEVFPSPANSAVKGASIVSLGWGVYNLFSSFKGTSSVDPKAKSDLEQAPALSAEAFRQLDGSIIYPAPGKPELTTDGFFGPTGFNIQVIWRNQSRESATFPYHVVAYSVAAPGIPSEGKTWVKSIAYESIANLNPGGQSPPINIFIALAQPPQKGVEAFGKSVYYMDLQLEKVEANSATLVGDPVRFGPFDFK